MATIELSRRSFLLSSFATLLAGCAPTFQEGAHPLSFASRRSPMPDPQFKRQHVPYTGSEPPGSIVVNVSERFLYAVEPDGWATRFGVAVGEEGLTFKGKAAVGRKAEWPSWQPTAAMIERKPRLAQYAEGVPGGEDNPLGARALYLYQGGRDTMFRIHGTNEPWMIGTAVSNGCIRLTNDDIVELYDRTAIGTDVLVI